MGPGQWGGYPLPPGPLCRGRGQYPSPHTHAGGTLHLSCLAILYRFHLELLKKREEHIVGQFSCKYCKTCMFLNWETRQNKL